jgi:hypothetical protein
MVGLLIKVRNPPSAWNWVQLQTRFATPLVAGKLIGISREVGRCKQAGVN